MTTTQTGVVLRRLRELVTAKDARNVPDQQLLEQFARGREEAAFEELVRRHGPLVLGVCRRVLHNGHDAEDAFQATFLVLARKAGTISRRAAVGSWLYRVAYHTAVRSRRQAASRQEREQRAAAPPEADPLAEVSGRELLAVFDEELQKLSEADRAPLLLCYLEGKTRDEAARQLGCSTSTLKRRLERGKERLRVRLARRGVALPAALLAAGLAQKASAVPVALAAATVRAGLLTAAGGGISGAAEALARGTLRAMTASKVKTFGAVLLTVCLAGAALWACRAPAAVPAEPPAKEQPAAPPAAPKPAEKHEMTVTGRVLDADGKPLPRASVAVLARPNLPYRGGELSAGGTQVLGQARADAEGRFRLDVPRTSSLKYRSVNVVAGAAGHGLGWGDLNPDAERPEAEVRLTREQVIRGRLVDLQGQPAANVVVRVSSVGLLGRGEFKGVHFSGPPKDLPVWPEPATTDDQGRYVIRGTGRGVRVILGVTDDRFATRGFMVDADPREGDREFNASLEPARIIEGVVAYADTGKPVPNARLTVYAAKSELDSWSGLDGRADEKGRFRINPTPGNLFQVSAYAPDGEPYLTLQKRIKWPKAAVKQHVELKLPRGVLVRGKVAEAGAGTAVAKASVIYTPRSDNPNGKKEVLTGWENTVVSGTGGTFEICVLPGRGTLTVHGTPHHVLIEAGSRTLDSGKPGGTRTYAHAFVPLDLKPGGPHEVAVALRRGVTVTGRLVGPDGKLVAEALMISRLNVSPLASYWRGFPVTVRDGKFALHGLDPAKSYPVHFLDARNKLGATAELSGKQAGTEVTVRLEPCGSASTRLVGADGKPVARQRVWLEMVVTPGPHRYDRKAYERGDLAADADMVANIDRFNHWNGPLTDAEGRVTLPALVPGATYQITEVPDMDDIVKQEFKAEAGKVLKLPDVVFKRRPG